MNLMNIENGENSATEPAATTEKNLSDNVLHHYWHAVALSQDVTDKPVAVKLLDHPVVLWRSTDRVAAFRDLCIHRGTPLSLGWIDNGI
jgi:phenylpropionate dioxygenase-like ring-hydroxylating dioxygenase large terminal subunit